MQQEHRGSDDRDALSVGLERPPARSRISQVLAGICPFDCAEGRPGSCAARREFVTVSQLHKFTDSQESQKMGWKSCARYGLQRTPQLHSFTGKLKSLAGGWVRPRRKSCARRQPERCFRSKKVKNREAWKRHWSHPHRKEKKATRIGIAAFLFLRLIPVYALEGYWTARVREEFESLVTSEFRFGKAIQSTELFFTEGL